MPVYQATPNKAAKQAVPGIVEYLLGSYLQDSEPTQMNISTVALAGTTATVTGTVIRGNIPVVGQSITITGAAPTYFNVSNATVLSVSGAASPDVGVYAVTFTLANSNIVATASTGTLIGNAPEVGESITLGGLSAWKSAALGLQAIQGPGVAKNLRASVRFPTALGGNCSVILQAADVDLEGAYVNVGSAIVNAATAANATMYAGTSAIVANFVRFSITGIVSPGSGKIVGTILI